MNLSVVTGVLAHVPLDWIIIVVFGVLVALDAIRGGLSRATALSIALPLTLLLISYLPKAAYLGAFISTLSVPLAMLLDAGVLIAVFVLMYRITDTFGPDSNSAVQSILAGAATVSIAVTIWIQVPVLESIWHFGPQVHAVFGEAYRLWWLILSYIALSAAKG